MCNSHSVMTSDHPMTWFIITFSNKGNQGSLEKWLILGLQKKYTKLGYSEVIYKMRLQKVRKYKTKTKIQGHWSQLKELQVAKAETV